MSIQALRAVWGTQFPLLSERVRASLFSQLAHIQDATTEAAVNEAVFLAKGFIVALLEAELTDEQGMHLLGTSLLRVESEALARIRATR